MIYVHIYQPSMQTPHQGVSTISVARLETHLYPATVELNMASGVAVKPSWRIRSATFSAATTRFRLGNSHGCGQDLEGPRNPTRWRKLEKTHHEFREDPSERQMMANSWQFCMFFLIMIYDIYDDDQFSNFLSR